MIIARQHYRPFRYPRYPGRTSTIDRGLSFAPSRPEPPQEVTFWAGDKAPSIDSVQPSGLEAGESLYFFSGWTVDVAQHLVINDQSEVITLSGGEFALLRVFVERPRRVLSRNHLLDLTTAMGSDVIDRVIDAQICRLRRRLAQDQRFIRTIRNEGYMFTERVRRVQSG